jgi:hypothetical protein
LGYVVSFLTVAGVAAWASYSHIRDVALVGHQPTKIASVLPLAIDGMMLVCSLAIADDRFYGRYARGWARFGFWCGAIVSTGINIASVVVYYGLDWLGIFMAGLAPLLLLLCIEVVSKVGRPRLDLQLQVQGAGGAPQLRLALDTPTMPAKPALAGAELAQSSGPDEVGEDPPAELVVVAAGNGTPAGVVPGNGHGPQGDESRRATAARDRAHNAVTMPVSRTPGRGAHKATAAGGRYQKSTDGDRIERVQALARESVDGRVSVREVARELRIGRDAAARLVHMTGLGRDDDLDQP